MIEVRISDALQLESRVTIHCETKSSKKKHVSFVSTILFRAEEAREEDDVGENAYNMKCSELVPLERGCRISGFLPSTACPDVRCRRVVYMYVYI